MLRKTSENMRRSRKGNMPFAMIAITLLVLAGMYGIVAANIERTGDSADAVRDEMNSVGDAAAAVKGTIESGIADIILDMSRETSSDGLEIRFGKFDERFAKWLDFQFPMGAAGAVAAIVSHDVELGIGTLKVAAESEYPSGGVVPSCFRADGTVTVRITTTSGSVERDLSISADGMSALPMLLGNAALFEQAVTGPWSLITELMSYQLSALAQYRVMSGYGSMSEYGDMGTNAIITDEDVRLAYRIALSAAEATYLHASSGSGYDLTDKDNADAAELIAFRSGMIEIDLGAVLAQTLVGIIDDLVISWMDYLMLTKVLDIIESVTDALKGAWNWLCRALTGKESESAQKYLSETMAGRGIPESQYRYLFNGMKGSIETEDLICEIDGTSVDLSGISVTFDYPGVDILNWNGWDGFMSSYRNEHNQIRDMIRETINTIAIGIAGSYNLGKVRVKYDPYDTVGFSDSMSLAIRTALKDRMAFVENCMESTIRNGKVTDTLYATIYDRMASGRDSLFGITALKDNISSAVRAGVTERIVSEYGMPIDPTVISSIVNHIMRSDAVKQTVSDYEEAVSGRMQMFGNILNHIEKDTRSMFKDIIVIVMRYGVIDRFGLYPLLEYKMMMLVDETAEITSVNPMAGVYGLPGTDMFDLGGTGNEMKEYVSLECDASVNVRVVPPSKNNENIHYVGFNEDHEASYSALFRIYVSADLTYRAASSSPVMRMLGTYDASVTGTSHSEFDLAVAVMSGWALAGVHYEPSRTVVDDIIMLFMKLIEPLLGPLYELIRLGKSVLHIISNVLMRAAEFVSDLLMKLYNAVMGPMQMFGELVSNVLGRIFENTITKMVLSLGSQTLEFNLYGMKLEVITDAVSELTKHASTTKIRLTLPVFGVTVAASLDVRKDKSSNFFFTGGISVAADSWNLDIVIDPLMKTRKHLVEINGTFRGTDIHAVMPQVVQYDEFEFRLSDIPGMGDILQNIPLPIPGLKGSLDAGVELKYNSPYAYGVVINEFELNPPGTDSGYEWVELYNSTRSPVDLNGYYISPLSGAGKKVFTLNTNVTIFPGERIIVDLPGQFLNNSKESVGLYDPDGILVDNTPVKSDDKNDDLSWQRETDGSTKWVFKKSTKGEDNGGKWGGTPMKVAIVACVKDAATQAFSEMGLKLVGPDGIALFLKRVVELTVQKAIEMIANCVVSASVFIEIAVSDVSGSLHSGIRFSLMIDRDIIKDGLTWIVGQIQAMMKNIDNPTGMTPRQILSDDIYFQTMIFAQVSTPKILGNSLGNRSVTAGLSVGCNITALCNLLGRPGGTWRVNIGLVLEDIPVYMIPPMIKVDPEKKADLWLFKMTLERSKK